jgi:hypothetical protein
MHAYQCFVVVPVVAIFGPEKTIEMLRGIFVDDIEECGRNLSSCVKKMNGNWVEIWFLLQNNHFFFWGGGVRKIAKSEY